VVAAHWVEVLAAEASISGSSDTVPGSSVAASGMEDADHGSMDEPYSGS
jgi:hypothetical protein